MADFYVRVVAEKGHRTKVAAICYQRLEQGRPADRMHILLSEEFGEKEILNKIKSLGLFEEGDRFSPIGPDVKGDLALLASCATRHGIVELRDANLQRFVAMKSEQASVQAGSATSEREKKQAQALLTEKKSHLVERITREAEQFLKELRAKTAAGSSG